MDFYGINIIGDVSVENTPDLGTSLSRFGTIYTSDLSVSGDIAGTGTPDIGTSISRFGTVYTTDVNVSGVSTMEDLAITGDITGTDTPDIGTVGNPFGTLYGEATSAQWGDLAEKYTSKEIYENGTVISVSHDPNFDVEICNNDLCTSVIGVISTQPGFTMGDKLKDGQYVSLTGLVPVKIIGMISKGDFIVATVGGCARAGKPNEIVHKIGVANKTDNNEGIKLVNCIIK